MGIAVAKTLTRTTSRQATIAKVSGTTRTGYRFLDYSGLRIADPGIAALLNLLGVPGQRPDD